MNRPDLARVHALASNSQIAPPHDRELLTGIIKRSAATRVFFARARRIILNDLLPEIRRLREENEQLQRKVERMQEERMQTGQRWGAA